MKLRDRLIKMLGGSTPEEVQQDYDIAVRISSMYRNAIKYICYKGMGPEGPTYYDWACEHCCRTCNKRNGWCDKFVIGPGPCIGIDIVPHICTTCRYFDDVNTGCMNSSPCVDHKNWKLKNG